MRFRLFDAAEEGTQIGDDYAVPGVPVSDGLFTVDLLLGPGAFEGEARWLEIAIDPTLSNNYITLSPRRQIRSTPNALFAMQAGYAVEAGSVTGGIDDADADPGNELITDIYLTGSALRIKESGLTYEIDLAGIVEAAGYERYSLDSPGGVPEDLLLIDSTGRVGIGTDGPQAQLHVAVPPLDYRPLQYAYVDQISPGVSFSNATDVVVKNGYAFVANGSITIFDVAVPEAVQLVVHLNEQDAEWEAIAGARQMERVSDALLVSTSHQDAFTILNVDDVDEPSVWGTIRNGENGVVHMESPAGFHVAEPYVYVACEGSDSLSILDLTDPSNPVQAGVAVADGVSFQNLDYATDVAISGNMAFVVAGNSNALTVIDISDPTAPTEVASFVGDDLFPAFLFPSAIEIIGTNAYITLFSGFAVFDITDPLNPVFRDSLSALDGYDDMVRIERMDIRGNYAYLPALFSETVTIVDISDPDNLQRASVLKKGRPGSENLLAPFGVFAEDDRFYVVSTQSGELTVFVNDPTYESLLVEGDTRISSTGSVRLRIEADTDNLEESDQPQIDIVQDGGLTSTRLGYFDGNNNFQIITEGVTGSHLILNPRNNVGINQPFPAFPLQVGTDSSNGNGAHVTAGGAWVNGSSREWKTNFAELDPAQILERLRTLPVSTWEYSGSSEGKHIGPTAEDFRAAFGLGHSDQYIATVDADGVALAAIKGLDAELKKKDVEIEQLEERLARLEALIATLSEEGSQ
jgi:hypothetical protein